MNIFNNFDVRQAPELIAKATIGAGIVSIGGGLTTLALNNLDLIGAATTTGATLTFGALGLVGVGIPAALIALTVGKKLAAKGREFITWNSNQAPANSGRPIEKLFKTWINAIGASALAAGSSFALGKGGVLSAEVASTATWISATVGFALVAIPVAILLAKKHS